MLAIRAGRAFDGTRFMPDGATVLVRDGRISAVEPGRPELPDGWTVVDHPRATLLPGLIDMHVHLGADSRLGALDRMAEYPDDELDQVIATALRRQLAAGVTTVRDLGDRRWSTLTWRDRIAAGTLDFAAPTVVAAGPPITSPRGHCWWMGGEAAGPDAVAAAVDEHAERGVDVVKVMGSGGALTPGTDVLVCQFDDAELRVVVERAHAAGLPVTVHAHGLPAVEQAVRFGADGIEHGVCLTTDGISMSDQLVARMAEHGTVVCPTLGRMADAVPPPAIREVMERTGMTWEARQQQAGRLYRGGVTLVSGVDAGVNAGKPHGLVAEAIADLVAGGIPVDAALASATSVAAGACGLGERKGRLRTGHDADLLLVDGDVRADLTALTRVERVLVRGAWA